MTYADVLRPSSKVNVLLYDLACVVVCSLVIGLSAQVVLPLPFTPVPVTGQTLAVLLIGALLGRVRGTLSVLAYLGQGVGGLPVFAGGTSGALYLVGPTGGYLLGFVPAAFLTGFLAERGWDRGVGTAFLAMLVGNAAIYTCGLPWLAQFVGHQNMLALGLVPFILGDLLKLGIAAAFLPLGWRLLGEKGEMDMKQTVGSVDKTIRIVLGLVLLVIAFATGIGAVLKVVFIVLGLIALVTAVSGVCPLYSVLGISTCKVKNE